MKSFQIQRIDNKSLDESFRETLHINQDNDKFTDKRLILGKYDLNSNKKSTRTLDVFQLNDKKDHFVVIEDKIIKEFKLIDNKILKGLNYYHATGSIKYCIKMESTYGNLCLLMDNNDIVFLYLNKKGFVHKTISLDRFLMGQQLLPLLSSVEGTVYTFSKAKDTIIEVDLRYDTFTRLPLQFKDFGEILHFDCYRNQCTYTATVFHIHKVTNILHLEIFQASNHDKSDTYTNLFRKKTFKIDKINQNFQLLKKIEDNNYIVVTLNNIILVSSTSIDIKRWTINGFLKKKLAELTHGITLFYHKNDNIINLKICDSYLRTVNISCHINRSDINWGSMMNKSSSKQTQSIFFLKQDMIYFRDASSVNKIAFTNSSDEDRNGYTMNKVHDKYRSQYGSTTYHCGLVRTNCGSIFQNYILGGTESSHPKSFIECNSWKVVPYKNIIKVGDLSNNSDVVSKIVTIGQRSLIVSGEMVYQFDHDNNNCTVFIQDFNTFEGYLTRSGSIISLPSADVIFCADVINMTSNTAMLDFLLTINSEGIVRVSSNISQEEEYIIYYERKHGLNVKLTTVSTVISDSGVYLLLCEGEYLRLYIDSILVSEISIKGRVIRECFIVKIDKDLTNGIALLSFDYGRVVLVDLTLKNIHFERTTSIRHCYKLFKGIINERILIAYQNKSILFIDFINWKTSILHIETNIRELSYRETVDETAELIIVDNCNDIYFIDFETNITINENVLKFKYSRKYDVPISMHELSSSDSSILLLSKNNKSGCINLDIMDIENGTFIPGGYSIPAVNHVTICVQSLSLNDHVYSPLGNSDSNDIFIVTYTKYEKPFYEIIEINRTNLSIRIIYKGALKIVPNLILMTKVTTSNQLVTFLGSGIETKDVTYHLDESNTRHVTVSDLNFVIGSDTFPVIDGEVNGDFIKTVNARGMCQIYRVDTLEHVTEEIGKANNRGSKSVPNILKPLIRQMLKTDLTDQKEQMFYHGTKFSNANLLDSVISSIMGKVSIPDDTIFASLNTNNEIILSQGMKELHGLAFSYQPSINIPHDRSLMKIIPIPEGLEFVVPKSSDDSKAKLMCKPLFMIIGEGSTRYIIVKCPDEISHVPGYFTSNIDMFPSRLPMKNYIHNNLYPNSSGSLVLQLLEFT